VRASPARRVKENRLVKVQASVDSAAVTVQTAEFDP
jgi:hypothetical protein